MTRSAPRLRPATRRRSWLGETLIAAALLALAAGDTLAQQETPGAGVPATGPVVEEAQQLRESGDAATDGALVVEPATDPDAVAPGPAAETAPAQPPVDPDNPGQPLLDRALETKLTAQSRNDLNEVIDLLDEAIAEGLDPGNQDFAEDVLVATLLQRGTLLTGAVLGRPITDPRRDPRWLTIRQLALTDLMRAVSLDDQQLDAWMLIGRLQSLPLGSASEARRAFTQVVRLGEAALADPELDDPKEGMLAQAYALRGAAQKSPADKLEDFGRAIELDPDKEEYLLLRARQLQATGDSEGCLEDIERAIELAPDNPKVHELKALALVMQQKLEEALESFDRATELDPDLLGPYRYRGGVYGQLGRIEEAIAQLDKALELQPNNLESLLIRSELLTSNDEHERALADIEAVLQQQPMLVRAHLMKARTLDRLGRTADAIQWLETLAQSDPKRADILMQLGAFYVDKQMPEKAIEVLDKVLGLVPDNELALRLRGDMHLTVGQHAEAIADFAKVLEQNDSDPGVLNNYAWTLSTSPFDALRDGTKAIKLATRACEATEYAAPHILSTLAAAYAEAGDFDQAIRYAEQAIAKAEEEGTLGEYDGQLGAELASYRAGEPWRELQQGPKDETQAGPPAEPLTGTVEDAVPDEPLESDPAPSRSFDF